MAKKSKKKLRKKSKYVAGGMYNNSIPETLRTTNIVAAESDPSVQAAREEELDNTTSQLIDNADILSSNIESQRADSNRNIMLQNRLDEMQSQSMDSAIGSTIKGTKTGLQAAKTLADRRLKNQVSKILAQQTLPEAGATTIQNVGTSAAQLGFKTSAEKATEEIIKQSGKKLTEEAAKQTVQSTAVPVASQAASAASNLNLVSLGANVVGTGIGMVADDNDPTTWTFGEATGDVLAETGEFAGYGTMIAPGIGTAIGAGVGFIKGLAEGFIKRGKSRREKRATEDSVQAQIDEGNVDTRRRLRSSLSNVAAGKVKRKTIYGYDLGQNTTAKRGGLRMATPRYGYKI